MKHRLGRHQKVIIEAMRAGAMLWNYEGRWFLNDDVVNRERCMGLYVYGYIMGGNAEDLPDRRWRQRYTLTEQGKATGL